MNVLELGEKLFANPELGYKEVKTKAILKEYLEERGFKLENECLNTAFSVSIGSGHPHIGLIAELDAIPTLGHPMASKTDNAAHACGHSTQCAIMAEAITKLKDLNLPGKVTLFFTPAEEFTDMAYRKQLIKEGKIKYIGGKTNMLALGLFDDCDLFIHLHASSDQNKHFALNTALAGFVYKQYTFVGKASHAAVLPHLGRNALSACSLFLNALGLMRESFCDEDHVRIHGIIADGGQTVNSIAEKASYECYIRCLNANTLKTLAARVDEAAVHCAKALGCDCKIETVPGYLPLKQNQTICKVIREVMLEYCKQEEIDDGSYSMAAGDVGDISVFKPIVQFGYTGFGGVIHGKDLCILDPERIYLETSAIVCKVVAKIANDPELIAAIIKEHQPLMSKEEYLQYLEG